MTTRADDQLRRVGAEFDTIRVRLTLWHLVLLAITLVGFGAFLALSLDYNLAIGLDRRLEAEAAQVAPLLDFEDGPPTLSDEESDQAPGDVLIVVTDERGARRFVNPGHPELPVMSEALTGAAAGRRAYATLRLGDGADWRVLTLPVSEAGGPVGVLQVGHSLQELAETRRQVVALLALAIPATLALAGVAGVVLAGQALGSLDRLTRAAATIGADDLTRRLDVPPRADEVARLARAFNDLLDRLERAFTRQRQFTADASHELRTPLALFIGQIDLALARARSAADYRQVLVSLREDATRMSDLVSQMLTLARADAGQQTLRREWLALRPLADDVLTALAPLATRHGVSLASDGDPAVAVEGDQTRLTQLMVNLIDNAITATPRGGAVIVSVACEGASARFDVVDTGVGIASEHLPHLFERFYRVDAARSRADGGTGLGLAICKWIVAAHDGEIAVASAPGRGTTVTVRLPLTVIDAPDGPSIGTGRPG